MAKILKPYTIIPEDLYVQRDADRQIRNIISDMGRPGFVLVSRQMGKTNLLINAKRNLETENDLFVYIDLSNPFTDARSCFENIIDVIIETNEKKVGHLFDEIQEKRKISKESPPHKQHTNELRLLLNSISGKLVVILDEIDALTKTDYSELIFSQIRSIYFSRVNFRELERLTYILSGVVEPTELIKDPKISPFNIGQKIFLNDFNESEFNQFIENARLNLSVAMKDRIFHWTGGNPRMIWEVCSEVENRLKMDTKNVDAVAFIDEIVQDLYLTAFDRPPVDNIRELVKKDRELRNAVVEIQYNKGKEVADRIKSKLYLSGIVNYEEDSVKIKNQIIREALNIEWIRVLEREDKGLFSLAVQHFERNQFEEALQAFSEFLSTNDFTTQEKSLASYHLGYIAYKNMNYEAALNYFADTTFNKNHDSYWYYLTQYLKGLIYYFQGAVEQSLSTLIEVVDSGRNDEIYMRGLLSFGAISMKSNKARKEEAESIFKRILDEVDQNRDKGKGDFKREIKTIAYYNLGLLEGKSVNAKEKYINAFDLCKINYKPIVGLSLFQNLEDEDDKRNLVKELIDIIIQNNLKPKEKAQEEPLEFSFEELYELIIIVMGSYKDIFTSELNSLLNLINKPHSDTLYDLATIASKSEKYSDAVTNILEEIYSNLKLPNYIVDEYVKYDTIRVLAYIESFTNSYDKQDEYFKMFKVGQKTNLNIFDLHLFLKQINANVDAAKYSEALILIDIILNYINLPIPAFKIYFLMFLDFQLTIYDKELPDQAKLLQTADKVLAYIEDNKADLLSNENIYPAQVQNVQDRADAVILSVTLPLISSKPVAKINRNDTVKVRYKDGLIVSAKFKKLQGDIEIGKCIILN